MRGKGKLLSYLLLQQLRIDEIDDSSNNLIPLTFHSPPAMDRFFDNANNCLSSSFLINATTGVNYHSQHVLFC